MNKINNLPLPTQEQITEIADRIGSDMLDHTNVNVVRLCSLILWQDVLLADSPKG
jgi:hypothetical protein